MIKRNKLKTYLFHFLEALPVKVGDHVYHYLQTQLGKSDLTGKYNSSFSSYTSLERIFLKAGINLERKRVLEIGSGWLPLIPYFLLYHGKAAAVDTYDLNRHYNPRQISVLNEYFKEKTGIEVFGATRAFNLPKEVSYYPKTDLIQRELGPVNLVFSRFVLEHVTPGDIEVMHRKFRDELASGTEIVHFISPSDHRAYDDASLSLQDFLRYSNSEWDKIQTRFDYHNRLRLPQYLELFRKLSLEIVLLEYENPPKDSIAFRNFRELPLHEDYVKYSEEELTAGSINIVLRVK